MRKKSARLKDFSILGILIVSIGLVLNRYNQRINPPDPSEEENIGN